MAWYSLPDATLQAILQARRSGVTVRGKIEKQTAGGLYLTKSKYETVATESHY